MTNALKKGFIVYYDYREHLDLLTDAECGQLFKALLDYGETHTVPELGGAVRMAFSFIKAQMDRDAAKYADTVRKRSEAGKKGGRPPKPKENDENQEETEKANAFSENQTEAKKQDTDTVTDTVTDTDTDTVTDTVKENNIYPPKGGSAPAPVDQVPYKAVMDLYHEICKSYPRLYKLTDTRKRQIAARWKEYGQSLDTFRELFKKAEASQFLKGKNDRGWKADFDWLLKTSKMAKVLEGNYDNTPAAGGRKEMVPEWMNKAPQNYADQLRQMLPELTDEPQGPNPELAARAEALKQSLNQDNAKAVRK